MGFEHVSAYTHSFGTVIGKRTDVGTAQAVFPDHGFLRFIEHFFVIRDFHAQNVSGAVEAFGVILKPEDGGSLFGLIGTNTFEHTESVMQ